MGKNRIALGAAMIAAGLATGEARAAYVFQWLASTGTPEGVESWFKRERSYMDTQIAATQSKYAKCESATKVSGTCPAREFHSLQEYKKIGKIINDSVSTFPNNATRAFQYQEGQLKALLQGLDAETTACKTNAACKNNVQYRRDAVNLAAQEIMRLQNDYLWQRKEQLMPVVCAPSPSPSPAISPSPNVTVAPSPTVTVTPGPVNVNGAY